MGDTKSLAGSSGGDAARDTTASSFGHNRNGKTRPNFCIDRDAFTRLDGYDNAIANALVQYAGLLPTMDPKYHMPVVDKCHCPVSFVPRMRNSASRHGLVGWLAA